MHTPNQQSTATAVENTSDDRGHITSEATTITWLCTSNRADCDCRMAITSHGGGSGSNSSSVSFVEPVSQSAITTTMKIMFIRELALLTQWLRPVYPGYDDRGRTISERTLKKRAMNQTEEYLH